MISVKKFKTLHPVPKMTKAEHLKLLVMKAKRVWELISSEELIEQGNLNSLTSTNIKSMVVELDNKVGIDQRTSELYKFIALCFCCRLVWVKKLTFDGEVLRTLEIWGPEELIPYVNISIGYYHTMSIKMREQLRIKGKNQNQYLRRKAREQKLKIYTTDPRKQANEFYKVIISVCDEEVKALYHSLAFGIMSNYQCYNALRLVDSTLVQEGNLNYKGFVKRYEIKRVIHASSIPYKFSQRRVLSKGLDEFNIFDK